jgi:hypothetical protein
LLRFSDRVPVIPTAQAEYRQILDKIGSATQDELLKDEMQDMPRLYREGRGCIAAQGSRTYGTNRPHSEVQNDYIKAFAPLVWESGKDSFGTGTKTTSVIIVYVEPISPDFSIGKGKYQIIYRVDVVYSDPAIYGCFG